jgi:hypothetical protein
VAAGEDYRIIDVTDRSVGLPDQDFWMFDEEIVVDMNYRPDGTQASRELVEARPQPVYSLAGHRTEGVCTV